MDWAYCWAYKIDLWEAWVCGFAVCFTVLALLGFIKWGRFNELINLFDHSDGLGKEDN